MFIRNFKITFWMNYLKLLVLAVLIPVLVPGQNLPTGRFSGAPVWMANSDTAPNTNLAHGDLVITETKDETLVKLTLFLEGPFGEGKMKTELAKADLIPLNQPFNIPPWNYDGNESVTSIPSENVVDWVLVDVRAADSAGSATPETIFVRKAGFLMSNGQIFNIDGISLLSFDTVFS
jgi:hypothetical protein